MSDSCMLLWSLDTTACASWVQAWGTILALGVAIFTVHRGHALHQAWSKHEKHEKQLHTIRYVMALLELTCSEIKGWLKNQNEKSGPEGVNELLSKLKLILVAVERADITTINANVEYAIDILAVIHAIHSLTESLSEVSTAYGGYLPELIAEVNVTYSIVDKRRHALLSLIRSLNPR